MYFTPFVCACVLTFSAAAKTELDERCEIEAYIVYFYTICSFCLDLSLIGDAMHEYIPNNKNKK